MFFIFVVLCYNINKIKPPLIPPLQGGQEILKYFNLYCFML